MSCEYARAVFGKSPKLADLCAHFNVPLINAHDARVDIAALAQCVAEAWRRGVMLADSGPLDTKTYKHSATGTKQ